MSLSTYLNPSAKCWPCSHLGQIFRVWEEKTLPGPRGSEGSQSTDPEIGWEPDSEDDFKESVSIRNPQAL